MSEKYQCPGCRNNLNVDNDIVLVAKTGEGKKGLIFLHTELGNYKTSIDSNLNLVKGDTVKFYCPICGENLTVNSHEKLAALFKVDDENKVERVVFSQVYGEQCTYIVDEKDITDYYGTDYNLYYINPDWIMLL